MSTFELVLSVDAINDIDQAVDYYNGDYILRNNSQGLSSKSTRI